MPRNVADYAFGIDRHPAGTTPPGPDQCGDGPAHIGVFRMAWLWLFLAGLLEIGWAVGLKYAEGFSRPLPSFLTVLSMVGSVALLGLALRHLPLSLGYAVWTGIGIIGTTVFGMIVLGEPADARRVACIGLVAAGIIGLKLG